MSRPFISVIIATARDSYGSLLGARDEHLMLRTFNSLSAQTEQCFEVIVVDSLHTLRDLHSEIFALGEWPFPWSVVKPDSWWLSQGFWALQNAFNTGAVASRGHQLLFCGDCCFFPPDAFSRSIALIERGLSPHFLCGRRLDGYMVDPASPVPAPLGDYQTIEDLDAAGKFIPSCFYGDTRLADPMMQANGCILPQHASWQWFYGYGFVPRIDFFSVNGWSELYDGDKALGDVELGSRLEMSGRLHFYMEKTLVAYEEMHERINFKIYGDINTSIRSNYDLVWYHRVHAITRAHTVRIPDTDLWRAVRGLITGLHGWPLRHDVLPPQVAAAAVHWIEHQPIFTLEDHCQGV